MTEDTFSDCYGDPGTRRRLENHTTRQHTPCSAHRGVSGRQPGNLLGIHRGFVTGIQVFQPAEGRGDHAAPHQLQRGALGAARPVPLRVHLRVRSVRANRFDRREAAPARARGGGTLPPGRGRGPRARAAPRRAPGARARRPAPNAARARAGCLAAIEAIGADAADAQMKTKRNWASSSESTALKLMGSGMVSAALLFARDMLFFSLAWIDHPPRPFLFSYGSADVAGRVWRRGGGFDAPGGPGVPIAGDSCIFGDRALGARRLICWHGTFSPSRGSPAPRFGRPWPERSVDAAASSHDRGQTAHQELGADAVDARGPRTLP